MAAIDVEAVRRIVGRVREAGRTVMDESESLDLLDACAIPTCSRMRVDVRGGRSALRAEADRLGYPVVLKGIVPGISHKTGAGLVHTGIRGEDALERAADAVVEAGGDRLAAWLLQSSVDSVRELACGLVRDASFGPAVLAGFGGVHAEIVRDTSFRVAPLVEADARSMLLELRTAGLLGPYRGGAPADGPAVRGVLIALGELGLAVDDVSEVDVNPLLITAGGAPVAVDALVVLSD